MPCPKLHRVVDIFFPTPEVVDFFPYPPSPYFYSSIFTTACAKRNIVVDFIFLSPEVVDFIFLSPEVVDFFSYLTIP